MSTPISIRKRAYIIADNKLALNAGWDTEMLSLELGDLQTLGFDLSLTGFGDDELAVLLNSGNPGLTDPDDIPEVPVEPVNRLGDVWLLGRHRLVCGDSTNPGVVARALNGVKPHLMVTDPPYGVSYDPTWRTILAENPTGIATGTVLNDDRADWREAWSLFPGDVGYVWHGGLHAGTVAESLEAAGFAIRSQIIWDKGRLVIGRGDYHWQHEPAWYAVGPPIVVPYRPLSDENRTHLRLHTLHQGRVFPDGTAQDAGEDTEAAGGERGVSSPRSLGDLFPHRLREEA